MLEGYCKPLSARPGEKLAFCGDPALQLSQAEVPLFGAKPVICSKTALAAFTAIREQGEGAPEHSETSHYSRFRSIHAELLALRGENPQFAPAFPAARTPPAHGVDALERIERPHQHGRGRSNGLRHHVDETVDAVIEIDVGVARRPVERRIPTRGSGRRMACRIRLADIRLHLDDDTARPHPSALVHEHGTEQIVGDQQRRAFVEGPRRDAHAPRGRSWPSRARARSTARATEGS